MTPATTHAPDSARLNALHFQEDAESGVRLFGDKTPDHFALFGLQPRLQLDLAALRETFLELSRRFHPDFHSASSEALRAEVLRRSSLVNNAYRVLRDLPKRAEYVIQLLVPGMQSNRNAVPPALLEEMFEIQEAGEALKVARMMADGPALEAAERAVAPLRAQVKEAREALERELDAHAAAFDAGMDAGAPDPARIESVLKAMRLTLDRLNYLRTVIRNLH